MTVSTLELAGAVLDWAQEPCGHGGNPYSHHFVELAQKAHLEASLAANVEYEACDGDVVVIDSLTALHEERRRRERKVDAQQRQRHGEAIARRKAVNTPWIPDEFVPADATYGRCSNCDKVYEIDDLDEYHDFWSRVTVGSEIPMGDCPSCGAFCYACQTPSLNDAEPKRSGVV